MKTTILIIFSFLLVLGAFLALNNFYEYYTHRNFHSYTTNIYRDGSYRDLKAYDSIETRIENEINSYKKSYQIDRLNLIINIIMLILTLIILVLNIIQYNRNQKKNGVDPNATR